MSVRVNFKIEGDATTCEFLQPHNLQISIGSFETWAPQLPDYPRGDYGKARDYEKITVPEIIRNQICEDTGIDFGNVKVTLIDPTKGTYVIKLYNAEAFLMFKLYYGFTV